jgi:spore maturation protein CgeB
VKKVKNGRYDLAFYATSGQDWMPPEAIREAGRYAPIVAWNSDDDWQWESYTKNLAPYFTFMVTTYPYIYEANRKQYPDLRLSQWGCYDRLTDFSHTKDMDLTFVGRIYGYRNRECRYLRAATGLQVFGEGSRLVRLGLPIFRGCTRIPGLMGQPIADYAKVNAIWNRSRISYTPLGSSADPHKLQIKGRVFQTGLSGTLMLCDNHPDLARYYEPSKEFVAFEDLADCVEKAKYYLGHETERARIAQAYHNRTKAEHLWQHRFVKLFQDIGLINV